MSKKYKEVTGTYHTFNEGFSNDSTMFVFHAEDTGGLHELLSTVEPDIVISCLTGEFDKLIAAHEAAAAYLWESGGRLLFLSSSNVFDGALDKPHYEGDSPKAESEYGKLKIICEELIIKTLGKNGVILRLPQIYGQNCPRVLELREAVKSHQPVWTLKNVYVNCTTNQQIAEWILHIIVNGLTGIFHVGTRDIWGYFAFRRNSFTCLIWSSPNLK